MLQNSVKKGSPVLYALIFSLYMFEFQLFSYLEGTVNGVLSKGHRVLKYGHVSEGH
jgi:hypothetical protein